MDWFLYDIGLRHERVNLLLFHAPLNSVSGATLGMMGDVTIVGGEGRHFKSISYFGGGGGEAGGFNKSKLIFF